jgi:hypothetical protein
MTWRVVRNFSLKVKIFFGKTKLFSNFMLRIFVIEKSGTRRLAESDESD